MDSVVRVKRSHQGLGRRAGAVLDRSQNRLERRVLENQCKEVRDRERPPSCLDALLGSGEEKLLANATSGFDCETFAFP